MGLQLQHSIHKERIEQFRGRLQKKLRDSFEEGPLTPKKEKLKYIYHEDLCLPKDFAQMLEVKVLADIYDIVYTITGSLPNLDNALGEYLERIQIHREICKGRAVREIQIRQKNRLFFRQAIGMANKYEDGIIKFLDRYFRYIENMAILCFNEFIRGVSQGSDSIIYNTTLTIQKAIDSSSSF